MTEKRSQPKRHHVLPQFYLRAWANKEGRVAMLDRDGREVQTGPKILAVERDFYTITGPNGEKDATVEEALASWDAKGAAVHSAFLRGEFPLTDEQRIEFGLWLGLQWLRGRSSRETGREFYDTFQKMLIKLGLQERQPPDPSAPHGSPANDDRRRAWDACGFAEICAVAAETVRNGPSAARVDLGSWL